MKFSKLALHLLVVASSLVATCATAGGEIAVIVKTTNSTFWQNVQKGSTDIVATPAMKGYTTSFSGPAAETEVADEVKLVENAISRKVAGIVLAPSDPEAFIPTLKKAFAARIPVILIDSPISSSGRIYYQAMLSTDNVKAGAMAAKALIAKVGTTGKIAVMSFVKGAGSEAARIKGFTEYIKARSSLTIVGPYYSNSDADTATKQTLEVLTNNPDLKGLFGANEPTAVGMGRAIAKAGKAGKVAAVGFDGNSDLQNFVKDGTLEGIVVQSAYNMGALGVRTVVDVLEGQRVPPVLDTGAVYVHKGNITKPEATNVLY